MMKKGFTLIELLLSLGIFLIVFTVMTQSYILLSGTIADIRQQESLAEYLSSITRTLNVDIDEYIINVDKSTSNNLVLSTPEKGITHDISYTLHPNSGGELELWRSEDGNVQKLSTEAFPIKEGAFLVSPKRNDPDKCLLHPTAGILLGVSLKNEIYYTQTSFVSPHSSSLYRSLCQ